MLFESGFGIVQIPPEGSPLTVNFKFWEICKILILGFILYKNQEDSDNFTDIITENNKNFLQIGSFEPIPHPPWGDSLLFCYFSYCLILFTLEQIHSCRTTCFDYFIIYSTFQYQSNLNTYPTTFRLTRKEKEMRGRNNQKNRDLFLCFLLIINFYK